MYKPIREALEALSEEFKRCSHAYPGLFHEILFCKGDDPTERPMMDFEQWRNFIAANSVDSGIWQEWHDAYGVAPFFTCERFYGNRAGIVEFKQLADSLSMVLRQVYDDPARRSDHWSHVIEHLYGLARTYPTPLLRTEDRLWGFTPPAEDVYEIRVTTERAEYQWDSSKKFLLHPAVCALQTNVFTAVTAYIKMVLDPESTLLIGEAEGDWNDYIPPLPKRLHEEIGLEVIPSGPVAADATKITETPEKAASLFHREGDTWRLRFQGDGNDILGFPSTLGFEYYAELLKHPNEQIECHDLDVRTGHVFTESDTDQKRDADLRQEHSYQLAIDVVEVKKLIAKYHKQLAQAEKGTPTYQKTESDLKAVKEYLRKNTNSEGKSRPLGAPPVEELRRNKIYANLYRCRLNIGKKMPHLAQFLRKITKWDGTRVTLQLLQPMRWQF